MELLKKLQATVNLFDIALDGEAKEDFATFFNLTKEAKLLNYKRNEYWSFTDERQLVSIGNAPNTKVDETGNTTIAEIGELTIPLIKTFIDKIISIKRDNNGVFNCLLKSGLWLSIAPSVQSYDDMKKRGE